MASAILVMAEHMVYEIDILDVIMDNTTTKNQFTKNYGFYSKTITRKNV